MFFLSILKAVHTETRLNFVRFVKHYVPFCPEPHLFNSSSLDLRPQSSTVVIAFVIFPPPLAQEQRMQSTRMMSPSVQMLSPHLPISRHSSCFSASTAASVDDAAASSYSFPHPFLTFHRVSHTFAPISYSWSNSTGLLLDNHHWSNSA